MRKSLCPLIITPIVLAAIAPASNARTWRVPADTANIPAAMDSAAAGDTVLVAPGTYIVETLPVKNGIVLTSESGPLATEITPEPYHWPSFGAFYCTGLPDRTEISGFTIHGYTPGLISDHSSTIWVSGCADIVIRNNVVGASNWSLLVDQYESSVAVYNNTFFAGGVEIRGDPGGFFSSHNVDMHHNIVWGWANIFDEGGILGSQIIACNDFESADEIPTFGTDNISADPLFCTKESGLERYGIDTRSPCAPSESNACGLMGALSPQCGPTPVKPATWGTIKSLFDADNEAP